MQKPSTATYNSPPPLPERPRVIGPSACKQNNASDYKPPQNVLKLIHLCDLVWRFEA